MVMPCQVSWQFVLIKSEESVHGLGAAASVVGLGVIGVTSAAQMLAPHASTAPEAPTTVRRTAAQVPSFTIQELPAAGVTNHDRASLVNRAGGKPQPPVVGCVTKQNFLQ